MRRLGTLVLIAVALTGALLATGASAHKVKFDTSVSAKFNAPDKKDPYATASFGGTVTAAKARCEGNRKVILKMRMADGTAAVVGTGVSNPGGEWLIQPSTAAPGSYFATVTKKVLRKSSKHRHVCRKAISKDVKVK